MKVENMTNNRGNKVPNQFILYINGQGTFFQSYDVIVAGKTPEGVKLDEKYWDYSHTTRKHRNIFLGEDSKTIKRKIKEGVYVLTDLNK